MNALLAAVLSSLNKITASAPTLVSGRTPVDGSGVTQPVSGTVVVNAGTNLNTAALALESGNLATLVARNPPLGATTMANSVPVTLSTDGAFSTNFGTVADTAATSDTGSFSLLALLKRGLQNWTTLQAKLPALGVSATSSGGISTVPADNTASGNITTQNLVPAGVATAGSSVEITLNGASGLAVQVTGTYTGQLSLQLTVDGTTWVTVGTSVFENSANASFSTVVLSGANSVYYATIGGALKARVSALAAVTGTAVVSVKAVQQTGVVNVGGVNSVGLLQGGQSAHSAASSGAPVRVGGRVQSAVDTTLVAGDASDLAITDGMAAVVKLNAVPQNDWTYAAAASGISNTTTAVTVKAAAAAGVRNYITGMDISTTALGVSTEIAIRDGAGGAVLWRGVLGTAAGAMPPIIFDTPLKGTAATLLEIVTLTASVTGSVYVNVRGYIAP